ncbi:hypothetical protein WMF28_00795 [Sorangium sp. So ce590]|uniref:GFA family protein n=1 Tax=Sorangium sp. So ce590 TaxID=3133317 RepID=UPI003F5EF6ED
MSEPAKHITTARCSCGSVELEATGAPILGAACYCDDCQAGARQIEALPDALPVRDPDGGTAYLLYRKDRLRCSKGDQLLQGHKIRETSPTSRVVAACCNSAMFLRFDGGPHWVSVYRARFEGDAPPLQMRINTKFKPGNGDVPSDVPSYSTFPLRFVAKLVAAKIAMLLRR